MTTYRIGEYLFNPPLWSLVLLVSDNQIYLRDFGTGSEQLLCEYFAHESGTPRDQHALFFIELLYGGSLYLISVVIHVEAFCNSTQCPDQFLLRRSSVGEAPISLTVLDSPSVTIYKTAFSLYF